MEWGYDAVVGQHQPASIGTICSNHLSTALRAISERRSGAGGRPSQPRASVASGPPSAPWRFSHHERFFLRRRAQRRVHDMTQQRCTNSRQTRKGQRPDENPSFEPHGRRQPPRPRLLQARRPIFPILGVFRLKGQSKRDGSIIVRSCKASQSPVYPIRDAILAVNHVSCPSLSSSDPRQWGETALKTSRLPGALSLLLGKIVVVPSLSLAPAITGQYDPTLPGTTVEEPTPRTTERSIAGSAAPDGLPS